ncbi:MAG: YfiR family protein [Deltaproteobacteria bacterium]|nr:YfiR family protein [Deltaproteobacteria bacterium]
MRRSTLTTVLVLTLAAALAGAAPAQEQAPPSAAAEPTRPAPPPAESPSVATQQVSLEQSIQAVFVTKFPFFVEWPQRTFAAAQAPFRLCLLGDAPFPGDIEEVASKRGVNGRVLEISHPGDLVQARQCQVLFVGSSETGRVAEILSALEGAAVLTVSPADRFTQAGGMIGFVRWRGRVGFEINTDAARRADLSISSQLLKLAVTGGER